MSSINIFEDEIIALLEDPFGPVGTELMFVAAEVVIPDARASLAIDAPSSLNERGQRRFERHEAPGPPWRRSGDMINNLSFTQPMIDEKGLVVYGTSEAIHHDRNYWIILRDGEGSQPGGYQVFVNDPRYIYNPITPS